MIYAKTELGQSALQSRSVALVPRQRSAFILFDGKRSTDEVLKATASLNVTVEDVAHLVMLGLIAGRADHPPAAASRPQLTQNTNCSPSLRSQEHYLRAYPIATRLTASLGLRGFRLNLAVEAAGDLDKLKLLAPKIREAVGPEKFLDLENALYY